MTLCQSSKVSLCVLRCLKWNMLSTKLQWHSCIFFSFSDNGSPLSEYDFDNRKNYWFDTHGHCHYMSMASTIQGKWRPQYCSFLRRTNKVVCQFQVNNWTFLCCCVAIRSSHTYHNVVWLHFYTFFIDHPKFISLAQVVPGPIQPWQCIKVA